MACSNRSLRVIHALSFLFLVSSKTTYTINTAHGATASVWPLWEIGTNNDHAYLALRPDFQQQLAQVHRELGIRYLRFMGIFNDDIGIVNKLHPSDPYSFFNADKIYDKMLSIGVKPIVELDFVPFSMTTDPTESKSFGPFPVYKGPPNNMTKWYDLIYKFVSHLADRYGHEEVASWYFDFWDEPNTGKWVDNNLTTFRETYIATTRAIEAVNKSFRIGAPGTAAGFWIPEFPAWAVKNNVKLDYVSVHMYQKRGYCGKDAIARHDGMLKCLEKLSYDINQVKQGLQIGISAYGCTIDSGRDSMGPHDTSYNIACFGTYASQLQALDPKQYVLMEFTSFSDLWDQNGVWPAPFHDGYGWLTNRGIKKATYCGLELLHKFATNRNRFLGMNHNVSQTNTTLEVLATIDGDKKEVAVFVFNWMSEGYPISSQDVVIDIVVGNGVSVPKLGLLHRIDDDNCNPHVVWQKQGSPTYPTEKQVAMMKNASIVVPEKVSGKAKNGNTASFEVSVPMYGVGVLVVSL